jgi:hypothetical protein
MREFLDFPWEFLFLSALKKRNSNISLEISREI